MNGILEFLAWAIIIPPGFLLLYLTLEAGNGLISLNRSNNPLSEKISTAILVPAHNEEAGIVDTIKGLQKSAPEARILVVADNCTDATAERARTTGCEVIERNDPVLRGKGFALDFGRQALRAEPVDVVIIIDADCRIDAGGADRLAQIAAAKGAPVQATYLLDPDLAAPPMVQISNFAMLVKNLYRARGHYRLAGGILLYGSGMAFPWDVFDEIPLATSEAVEDMKLGIDFARAGRPIHLDDQTLVSSPAASLKDSIGQRKRWEHGFISMATRYALPLIGQGLVKPSRQMVATGLHMLVPPLALLYMLAMAGLLISAGLGLWIANLWPAICLLSALCMATFVLALVWLRDGRKFLSTSALIRLPAYLLWKIPVYLGFFTARQTSWNRTPRGPTPS